MTDRVVYRGRKFSVAKRRIVDRAGGVREVDVITHPGAAVIIPILPNGKIVLISNQRAAVGETLLELPAGTIDPPEAPLKCAMRELAEETGYSATKFRALVSFYSTPGICSERMHVFIATGLKAGEAALEPGEHIAPRPMTLAAALRAVKTGRVRDAKTLVALLYYDRFVRKSGDAAGGQTRKVNASGKRTRATGRAG